MTWSPDASITGGAQTGFTSPTFTLAAMQAPAVNAKQYAVTALGGTQGTATANTISSPFTATFFSPASPKALPSANPVTGLRGSIPFNKWKLVIRKGGEVAAGVPATAVCRVEWEIPAGMETYNPDNLRAFVSFLVGLLNEESADIGDTHVTGVA